MEYYKEESVAFNSYNEHYILSNMYPCDLICNYSAPPMGMSNRLTVVLQQELH